MRIPFPFKVIGMGTEAKVNFQDFVIFEPKARGFLIISYFFQRNHN